MEKPGGHGDRGNSDDGDSGWVGECVANDSSVYSPSAIIMQGIMQGIMLYCCLLLCTYMNYCLSGCYCWPWSGGTPLFDHGSNPTGKMLEVLEKLEVLDWSVQQPQRMVELARL